MRGPWIEPKLTGVNFELALRGLRMAWILALGMDLGIGYVIYYDLNGLEETEFVKSEMEGKLFEMNP